MKPELCPFCGGDFVNLEEALGDEHYCIVDREKVEKEIRKLHEYIAKNPEGYNPDGCINDIFEMFRQLVKSRIGR